MGRKTPIITLSTEERRFFDFQTIRTIQSQTACRAGILLLKADGVFIDKVAA